MFNLYGSRTATAVVDFPNRFEMLYKRLPKDSPTTPDLLIEKHTIFSLFRPFLPEQRAERIIKYMKGSTKGGSIHTTIGVMASSISSPGFLRFCPKCIEENEAEFGEPYWHRTHQIAGVFVCPKHQVWLFESEIPISSRATKQAFCLIPKEPTGKQLSPAAGSLHFSFYLAFAEAVYWLLNNATPILGLNNIRKRYISYLQEKELATHTGRIRQQELCEEFTRFFGKDFLKSVDSEVGYSQDNWLSKLVRKPRVTTHPLHHILLMYFLGLSPEVFFSNKRTLNMPFRRGPWPCLNPVSGHYHQNVIQTVTVHYDYKTRDPVGRFECACGFKYTRKGPDRTESDRYRMGRIISFGPVWKETLLRLMSDEKAGLRETARILNVDPKTVKTQYKKLLKESINNPLQKGSVLETDGLPLEIYRDEWLNNLANNPDKNKKELRFMAYATYTWLYRNDREWLNEHQPPVKRKKSNYQRVSWEQRDAELANQVLFAGAKLKIKRDKPVRLTYSSIFKETGTAMLLEKNISRLPKTKKVLDQIIETRDDFQCRRVRHAVYKIRYFEGSLLEWRIVREARLRPMFSKRVAAEIRKVISME